jgi:RHS repeat-associated protein
LLCEVSRLRTQLAKVTDSPSGNDAEGFIDGNKSSIDYTYDLNGNLITDKNKNITEIIYNHLNLPTKITFGTTGNIVYFYNASGQKMQKIVTDGTNTTTTDYLGGYQYQNTVLQFFPTAEGYVKNTPVSGTNAYSYVFNYTDHLGNVRLSYTQNPSTNSLTILEENSYYPFGLKHTVSNAVVQGQDYKYKFNGKELQDELGLNEYAYGWRDYDPAIGRWNVIDQLAEKYYRISPYAYVANNPITTIDPDGRYLFGLFGSTSAERKEARAEKYAAKVGGSVVKGENGRVSVNVVRGTADGSMTITTKSNFSDFATLTGNIKKWTTSHKEQLIGVAKGIQKIGDNATKAGITGAAVGAAATAIVGGEGAAPGIVVAGLGSGVSGFGSILEIGVKLITGDEEAMKDIGGFVTGKIVEAGANKILPGAGPTASQEIKSAVKVTREVIKNETSKKAEELISE